MKKRSFLISIFIVFISFFSSNTFGQEDSGGSAGGGGPDVHPVSQPSPVSFKRNNGNGTCGAEAQVRVVFELIPDYMPVMEEIKCEGIRIPAHFGAIDTSQLAKKKYVSYCIGFPNTPPAKKLAIKFHYLKTNQTFWLMESDNF